MLQPIWRLNSWYDRITEPRRFFIFMIVIMIPLAILNTFGAKGHLAFVGIAFVLVLMRVVHLRRRKQNEN